MMLHCGQETAQMVLPKKWVSLLWRAGQCCFLCFYSHKTNLSYFNPVVKESHRAPTVYLMEEEVNVNPSNRLSSLKKVEV